MLKGDMGYKIKLDPLAKLDIDDNIDWYEQQQPGLGIRFYQNVKDAFRLIEQNPFSFPIKYKNTRATVVNAFPFTIYYIINQENNTIAILSVFKTPQHPDKWKSRT
ncbi:MAG: type II toxin-antitoxin system RelE/ParE family toxin [Bacteroidota bacterium]